MTKKNKRYLDNKAWLQIGLYLLLIIILIMVGIEEYRTNPANKAFDWNPILTIAGIFGIIFPPIQILLSNLKRSDNYWTDVKQELHSLFPNDIQKTKLFLSGVSVMDFTDTFIDFVISKSSNFKGKLHFYNIPLQTFEKPQDFKDLWLEILKNKQIKSINFLIDEKYLSDIRNCFNYAETQKEELRLYSKNNDIDYNKLVFIVRKLRDPDNSLSRVNFGLWSEGNNLVTMTGHFTPFGHPDNERALNRFIAFNESENEILKRIKETVIHLFSAKDGILTETTFKTMLS